MMHSGRNVRFGATALGLTALSVAVAGCSNEPARDNASAPAAEVATAPADATPAAPTAPAAPAADNTDTVSGVKYAAYTGDAAKGATAFVTCKTCHAVEEGVNKIGPSLKGIVGRQAGTIAGFNYTPANKNSGITWTPEKLFQYLENPQRVVPGTKMAFAGFADPQKRADVIAYLQSNP